MSEGQLVKRGGGPKSEVGRAKAAKNAIKHGILSREIVIAALGESAGEYRRLAQRLAEEWEPTTTAEAMLVEDITLTYWRLRRVYIAEAGMLTRRAEEVADRIILLRRQAAQRQPTPIHRLPAEPTDLSEDEAALLAGSQLLGVVDAERIGRHESRLKRQLYDAIDRLARLQSARVALGGISPVDH